MKNEWPEDERINVIGSNGNDGEHYKLQPANKYEFVIRCKHTGQPVVADVYAILKALPQRLSPEVEHSVKKLLCAGLRNGGKSYEQDIEEAMNQLQQELDYLERVKNDKS